MNIAPIQIYNHNNTAFRGVFGAFKKQAQELNKKHEPGTTDYVDEFEKNIGDIHSWYDKEKRRIMTNYFFTEGKLRRLDDEYKGRQNAWQEDQKIFTNAKKQHLKDMQTLLDNAAKYNMTLDEINKLKSDIKATQATIQLVQKQQEANKHSGFSKIAGYEAEKATLQNVLINKIYEKQAGLPAELPNAILFFGPTGVGKTTFATALAQEIKEGSNPIAIDMTNEPDEIMEEIEVMTRRARKHYKETGERSIILLDEIEAIAHNDSEILDELKAKLSKAAEDDKCVYVMTSNNPNLISKDILTPNRTGLVISVDPPNYDNIAAVTKYYFSNLELPNLDYNKINNIFENGNKGNKYSNSGIEEAYKMCCSKNVTSTDEIIDIIRKMEPNITSSELKQFEEEKKKLLGI